MSKHHRSSRNIGGTEKKSGDFFDRFFDVTGDGRATSTDFFIMHQVMNSTQNSIGESKSNVYGTFIDTGDDDFDWQLYADEGEDYGIDPYDYFSREEYLEAVEDAALREIVGAEETSDDDDWRLDSDEGEEYGLDPYDFDAREEYLDAVEEEELRALANEEDQVAEVDGVEEGDELSEDAENAAFSKEALASVTKVPASFDCWLGELLCEDRVQEAEEALTLLVENPRLADGQLRLLLENTLHYCKNYEELETIERFRDSLFPVFMSHADETMRGHRLGWEAEIASYISYEEEYNEKYQYSHKYAWREAYRNEQPDPCEYVSEEKYLKVREERKRRHKWFCNMGEPYGLNPDQFSDEDAFFEALRQARIKASADAVVERDEKKKGAQLLRDGIGIEIYEYCRVLLPNSIEAYCYLTGGLSLAIGDQVVVPAGEDNREVNGVVASVEKHTRITVPYPVEKTKKVLRKASEVDNTMGD